MIDQQISGIARGIEHLLPSCTVTSHIIKKSILSHYIPNTMGEVDERWGQILLDHELIFLVQPSEWEISPDKGPTRINTVFSTRERPAKELLPHNYWPSRNRRQEGRTACGEDSKPVRVRKCPGCSFHQGNEKFDFLDTSVCD